MIEAVEDEWLTEDAPKGSLMTPTQMTFSATAEAGQQLEPTESDSLLFNPCEDELNQMWVQKMLLNDKSDENFSCAKCFTAVSFGPQTKSKELRELFPESKHVVE